MKIFMILMLSVSLAQSGFAASSIKPIKKNESAPYDGYVINEEAEKNFRQINEEKKHLEKVNIKLEDLGQKQAKIIDNQDRRIELNQSLNEKLILAEERKEREGFWMKAIYFLGGAVMASIVAYGAARSGR